MKILLLGGTVFLGRAIVEAALARGHEITLFNRGKSNPGLYSHLEQIHGDRDGGLEVLASRRWDVVIDTCGYVPRLVRDAAAFLADKVDHYTFISTISVYSDNNIVNMDESGPLGILEDETVEQITGESYGPLKVLCEQAATEAMRGRALHVRAGLIVGPYDRSDRFTYWPVRVARGGEILAPGSPDDPTQFIDVRDLAAWTIHASEARLTGPYNVTGPDYRLTMGQLLQTCHQVIGRDAHFTWVNDAFLQEQQVGPFVEMPLWIPQEGNAGFSTVNCQKAIAAGLQFRPLAETILDTLTWSNTRIDYNWPRTLKPEREIELLAAWQQRP
ncbi:MAG: SDR family oxidoreductase [Anaerolineae bacterium]|nr:SDR family oxidoreductase [Anaerolineae bacterium]